MVASCVVRAFFPNQERRIKDKVAGIVLTHPAAQKELDDRNAFHTRSTEVIHPGLAGNDRSLTGNGLVCFCGSD